MIIVHESLCPLILIAATPLYQDVSGLLLTEPAHNPKECRERSIEVAFESLDAPQFYLAVQAVLSTYSAGRSTGLVVDSGDGICLCADNAVSELSVATLKCVCTVYTHAPQGVLLLPSHPTSCCPNEYSAMWSSGYAQSCRPIYCQSFWACQAIFPL